MVIDNLDLIGISSFPPEANAPLLVDADAPLPGAVMGQRFQPVGGRQPQIFDAGNGIELRQAHRRAFQDFRGQAARFTRGEKVLSFRVGE